MLQVSYTHRSSRCAWAQRVWAVASLLIVVSLTFLIEWSPAAAQEPVPTNVPQLGDALSKLKAMHAPVSLVAFSPDSTELALTVRYANTVYVYEVSDWKLVHILHGQRPACCRVYSLS